MPIKSLEEAFDIIDRNRCIALQGGFTNGDEYEMELVNNNKNQILFEEEFIDTPNIINCKVSEKMIYNLELNIEFFNSLEQPQKIVSSYDFKYEECQINEYEYVDSNENLNFEDIKVKVA